MKKIENITVGNGLCAVPNCIYKRIFRGCKKSPQKKQAAPKGAACKTFIEKRLQPVEEAAVL